MDMAQEREVLGVWEFWKISYKATIHTRPQLKILYKDKINMVLF